MKNPEAVTQEASLSLGQYVGSLKTSKDNVHNREALLERCRRKYETPTVAGLPMVGLGGSRGKPAFLLPFVVRSANLADSWHSFGTVCGKRKRL